MKISGFTIIKNAVINDFPIVEAINSILEVVDEMVVLCGDSTDQTKELIKSIDSDKIKIYDSVWNPELRAGGAVLADETNKAFNLISPDSDWAFYIQADEALHEKYYTEVRNACKQYLNNPKVLGLVFRYTHFYGNYDYVGDSRKWYGHEIRIIRNDKRIKSYKDAQGFRINNKKLPCKKINASIYHYGWVKSPVKMQEKLNNIASLWNDDDKLKDAITNETFDFTNFDSLKRFEGTHPLALQERIKNKNWEVKLDLDKKKMPLIKKILYHFEKFTGLRPFEFRNYRIVK